MFIKENNTNNIRFIRHLIVFLCASMIILTTSASTLSIDTFRLLNNPPYAPANPHPAHNSTNISITPFLSWTGGDPDNDTVTYDIYFGTVNPPEKIAANYSNTTYTILENLQYSTTYYWKIIAWDNHSASTHGPLWSFTTKQKPQVSVIITKPLEKTLYIQDEQKISLPKRTIIYGPITITANATAEYGIEKVEFYVNGKLIGTDDTEPYTCVWKPLIQFNGISLLHTITVKAIDTHGNNVTASINVTKWRFHVLPWMIGAIAGAAAFSKAMIPHTTIRGFVFNLKRTTTGWSFFALNLHYTTVGLFKTQQGTINFRRCTVNNFIGPRIIKNFGLFQKLSWISFTSLGRMHIYQGCHSF